MHHEVIFVVDDNRLQAQALLLAATLRDHLGPQVRIVAYIPQARLQLLNPMTVQLLSACGVELRSFEVPRGTWRKPFPHGNKIIACADAEQRALADPADWPGRITFLDTDMICQGDFLTAFPENDHVLAVPEGRRTWGKREGDWQRAYAFFDLPLPQERVRLVRARQVLNWPYFNAGLVSFPVVRLPSPQGGFAAAWLDTARRFDHCPIANKRPWLDQITLPLTLYRLGFGWTALPQEFNYSASNLVQFSGVERAKLLHYHKGVHLNLLPKPTGQALRSVSARLPEASHEELQGYLELHLGLGPIGQTPPADPAERQPSP